MRTLKNIVIASVGVCSLGLVPMSFGQLQGALTSLPPQSGAVTDKLHSTGGISVALTAVPEDFSKLKIAPGFLLNLDVYDAPELSGSFRVDAGGNVTLPLIGAIPVDGLTIPDAQGRIRAAYVKEDMLRDPQVTINIQEYAPFVVAVTGEVTSPGRIQLLAPRSLLDVLTQVGGLTDLAGNIVLVKHTVGGVDQTATYEYSKGSNGETIKNVIIENGDTVIVPRAGIVYVLGAVLRPGGYVMQEDGKLDVAQAISMAQGASRDAKTGSIRVIRRKPDGSTLEFPIDYSAISKGKQTPLPLQAQDIVYIPVSKAKAIFTNSQGILGSTASATIYTLR